METDTSSKNIKNDRRVKYTKMVLRQSLLELMHDNRIEKITIKDICDRADINRGTFYSHYSDQYDLLRHIEDELLASILESLEGYQYKDSPDKTGSTFDVVKNIFECISDNSDVCRILLGENGDAEFVRKIMYIAKERCTKEWETALQGAGREKYELLFSFIANGSVGVIQTWIHDDMKESPKQIADIVERMAYRGLYSFA